MQSCKNTSMVPQAQFLVPTWFLKICGKFCQNAFSNWLINSLYICFLPKITDWLSSRVKTTVVRNPLTFSASYNAQNIWEHNKKDRRTYPRVQLFFCTIFESTRIFCCINQYSQQESKNTLYNKGQGLQALTGIIYNKT